MTNNQITLDKEYQTRYGRPVRVHATDIGGFQPVLASYLDNYGEWIVTTRLSDGRVFSDGEHPLDLIEKPRTHKIVCYLNVYEDGPYSVWPTREKADTHANSNRIACKRIEFVVQEGEFDE